MKIEGFTLNRALNIFTWGGGVVNKQRPPETMSDHSDVSGFYKKSFTVIRNEVETIPLMLTGPCMNLKKFTKTNDKIKEEYLSDVLFVPNLKGIKD